ncbi:uncharacterized protein EV154DRAFT_492833 [Mucor mucedo]|uniref:uncharacterized protein n=1 Tax=Mucor mucedo TaxID=29922 RepID=UPI00221EBC96|nr:uncharacterized protein EV154DRAFT_492833 [Mucor mucedo]KAI7896267.1 hypothetical protein EV154DRAFT_492833 [Mucor mucedo]
MEASVVEESTNISPRTVRTNWLLFSWSQISSATKALLLISTLLALIQIAVTIVVLVLGNRQQLSCEKPLQLYLTIFVVRVGLSLPLSVYQHLFIPRRGRPRRARNHNNNNNNINISNNNNNNNNNNNSNNDTTHDDAINQESTNRPETPPHNRPSTIFSGWAERLKSLLDLFAILWFIVGNYLVFSQSTCALNAGLYYYTILTWIIFGYTILVIPLLACASVVFCLPCVLVAMRTFNINISNVMVGGSKEEIAKIPVFKYKKSEAGEDEETTGSKPVMKKKSYFSKFKKEHHVTTDKYLSIPKAEDAVCTICLSEYENDEFICKLWCEHHYHHSCVTEWLGLNSKCPLCKRDFRKDHVDQDSDEEV